LQNIVGESLNECKWRVWQGRSTHSGWSGHAQIMLFAKLDVGRANPQLKQLSGAGKSMIAQ